MSAKDWGDIDAPSYETKERMSDKIVLVNKKKLRKYKPFRFYRGIHTYMEAWFPLYKDGKRLLNKEKKPVNIPKMITTYDMENHKLIDDSCPYLKLIIKMNKYLGEKEQIRSQHIFMANAIDRELQDEMSDRLENKKFKPTKEERESGFKDIESKSATPVVAWDMKPTLFRKVKGFNELNEYKVDGEKRIFPVSHTKYGRDIQIKFDPDEKGPSMYDAQMTGDRTPLTDDEKGYLKWDIEGAIGKPESKEEAEKEADRLWKEFKKSLKDSDDEDSPKDLKKKKKDKNKKKDKDDDTSPFNEDDKPKKKDKDKKKKNKDKKKSSDEPLDLDDDDSDKKKKNKDKDKKKSSDDDDEDKPKKKKSLDDEPKKKKKKKKSSDDDLNLDLDDD
jgi:hypothetical protein